MRNGLFEKTEVFESNIDDCFLEIIYKAIADDIEVQMKMGDSDVREGMLDLNKVCSITVNGKNHILYRIKNVIDITNHQISFRNSIVLDLE